VNPKNHREQPILIVAGESSGERYGAEVVDEFRRLRPGVEFFGVGGRRMAAAGVDLLFTVDELSAVGVFEVVSRLPHFGRLLGRLKKEVADRRPAAALLIDSPDFNLRLAKGLKAARVPVVYYISPTVWAWRRGRLNAIRQRVDRMLLIFPFEQKIYDEQGIPATFVGHPLRDKVAVRLGRQEFLAKHRLRADLPLIGLLPGSRRTELRYHLPVLVPAVERLRAAMSVQFALVLAENLSDQALDGLTEFAGGGVTVLKEDAYEAMAYSELLLAACGTANLEAALLGTPLVAFYRLSPLTYYPFRSLLRIHDYSIVNILSGKTIVPELIQRQFNPRRLADEACRLLASEERKSTMRAEFARLRDALGHGRAAANVARALAEVLDRPPQSRWAAGAPPGANRSLGRTNSTRS
jgi:lipid-A-disaccharide synthase